MKIGPYTIDIKNRDKIFFPEKKITKGELIDYYDQITDYMLPFLKGRPLTLSRFPDGIEGEGFYQKECPEYFANWIDVMEIKRKEKSSIPQIICNNRATLIYLINEGTLSLHSWQSTTTDINKPNKLVFDLDPPAGDFELVRQGALALRSFLEKKLQLNTFVMTTGSEGLHVVIPIKPTKSFEEVRSFAKDVADYMAAINPDSFTSALRKEKREGRLFFDYMRNVYAQTSITPYSVRALKGAPIATPLNWDELDKGGLTSQSYHIKNIFRRLSQKKPPWKQFRNKAKDLEKSIDKINRLVQKK